MPVTDDLQLPIERTILSGPAVDALENRKEIGRLTPVTTAEMRASWGRVKDRIHDGLRQLTRTR